jgi:hypothetical protein
VSALARAARACAMASAASGVSNSTSASPSLCAGVLHRPAAFEGINEVVSAAAERRSASSLAECANLAPAGTGTISLSNVLSGRSNHSHHDHSRNASQLYFAGARCFIVTLRDPVERLRTAFAFYHSGHKGSVGAWSPLKTAIEGLKLSPNKLIGAFPGAPGSVLAAWHERHVNSSHRDREMAAQATIRLMYYTNLVRQVSSWRAATDAADSPSPAQMALVDPRHDASPFPQLPPSAILRYVKRPEHFLTAVADYLHEFRRLPDAELHVVCTSNFSAGWTRLLRRFGHSDEHSNATRVGTDAATSRESHPLHSSGSSHHSYRSVFGDKLAANSFFSPEAEQFVRECLYPEDWKLVQMFCS